MYVYVCMYMYACIYIYIYVYNNVHINMYMYMGKYVYFDLLLCSHETIGSALATRCPEPVTGRLAVVHIF